MLPGWIKLYRSLLADPVWTTATSDQKAVLVAILLLASHESRQWVWDGQKFEVKPGQFITSLASMAKAAGVSVMSVRSAIARFEKLSFLTNISTKTGRLISIVNWHRYQSAEYAPDKDASKDPTKTQQLSRSKEVKNTYGEFQNVLLTEGEHSKLVQRFNGTTAQRIEDLSIYLEKHPSKKYGSHYATILSWVRREEAARPPQGFVE